MVKKKWCSDDYWIILCAEIGRNCTKMGFLIVSVGKKRLGDLVLLFKKTTTTRKDVLDQPACLFVKLWLISERRSCCLIVCNQCFSNKSNTRYVARPIFLNHSRGYRPNWPLLSPISKLLYVTMKLKLQTISLTLIFISFSYRSSDTYQLKKFQQVSRSRNVSDGVS